MFYDEATITVKSGSGGRGCVSFRREKFVPRGGPNGGDGGRGGDVVLVADESTSSLYDLSRTPNLSAANGRPGEGSLKTGASGEDLVIKVPPGTVVRLEGSEDVLDDLTSPGVRIVIAAGGRGGRGNKAFATATNQAPREFEDGEPGEAKTLALELKLIADVGLVGLPNAGKSTLLSRVSRARPRIASYPFTTKRPHLGIAELPGFRRLVIADLPGLIKGAHEGVGLGDRFLRHIERTRVIVHLVDAAEDDVAENYDVIRGELAGYSPKLADKPEVVVLSKADLVTGGDARRKVSAALDREALFMSAVTGEGVGEVLEAAWRAFEKRTEE